MLHFQHTLLDGEIDSILCPLANQEAKYVQTAKTMKVAAVAAHIDVQENMMEPLVL
jgi:hypothetical protein